MWLREELLPPKERSWEQSLGSSAPVRRAARPAQPCSALRELHSLPGDGEAGGGRETLPENQRLPDIPGRGLLLLPLLQRLRWHSPRIFMCLHSLAAGQPLFIFFFPLRKHPQKGNERLQPFLSADSRADNEEKFSGIGTYCLEGSIIYQVQVSFSSSRTNQGRLKCWKQLKGWWGKGGSAWAPPWMVAVFQLAWIPQEAVSRGTVLLLCYYLNPSDFFFPVWCRTRSVWLRTEMWFVPSHSIPEAWGPWLHVCVHGAMCGGIPGSAGTQQCSEGAAARPSGRGPLCDPLRCS